MRGKSHVLKQMTFTFSIEKAGNDKTKSDIFQHTKHLEHFATTRDHKKQETIIESVVQKNK